MSSAPSDHPGGIRSVWQSALGHSDQALIAAAEEASRSAYAPYSGFHVGAAIRTADGGIVSGCNVENASYGLTICAEIGAIMAGVRQGQLPFTAIAIYGRAGGPDAPGPRSGRPLTPCGRCRQVIAEMAMAGRQPIRILCSDPGREQALVGTAADFLPFGLEDGLMDAVGPTSQPLRAAE